MPEDLFGPEDLFEGEQQLPEGTKLDSFIEPLQAIAGTAVGDSIAGITGLLTLAATQDPARATKMIQDIQSYTQGIVAPETQAGQAGMEAVGEGMETVMTGVRAPVAGVMGIGAGINQGSMDAATQKVEKVFSEGIGQTLGDDVFDITGNPEAATAAYMLPEAIAARFGFKTGKTAAPKAGAAMAVGADNVIAGIDNAIKTVMREPNIRMLDADGQITPHAISKLEELQAAGVDPKQIDQAVAAKLQEGGVLTPEQAQRFNLFTKRDVPVLRSDVTQAGDDLMESKELMKGSGPVADVAADQDAALIQAAKDGRESMGGVTTKIVDTNDNLFEVMDKTVGNAETLVDEAYTAAKNAIPEEKVVRLDTFMDTLKNNIGNESATGGLISSVRQELKNRGLMKGNQFKSLGRIDVATSEGIRQQINAIVNDLIDSNPRAGNVGRELKDALDTDVADAVGNDYFEAARRSRVELDQLVRRQKRDMRDKSKNSLVEDILYNKVKQEKILDRILKAPDEDFANVKDFYLNRSGPEGIQAWQNLKGQVFDDALQKATKGKTEGGGVEFNGETFKKQFSNLSRTKKYDELFNEAERALIDDLAEISFLRKAKFGSGQGKGPTARAVAEVDLAKKGVSDSQEAILRVLNMATMSGSGRIGMNAKSMRDRAIKRAEKNLEEVRDVSAQKQINVLDETEGALIELEKAERRGTM